MKSIIYSQLLLLKYSNHQIINSQICLYNSIFPLLSASVALWSPVLKGGI